MGNPGNMTWKSYLFNKLAKEFTIWLHYAPLIIEINLYCCQVWTTSSWFLRTSNWAVCCIPIFVGPITNHCSIYLLIDLHNMPANDYHKYHPLNPKSRWGLNHTSNSSFFAGFWVWRLCPNCSCNESNGAVMGFGPVARWRLVAPGCLCGMSCWPLPIPDVNCHGFIRVDWQGRTENWDWDRGILQMGVY